MAFCQASHRTARKLSAVEFIICMFLSDNRCRCLSADLLTGQFNDYFGSELWAILAVSHYSVS